MQKRVFMLLIPVAIIVGIMIARLTRPEIAPPSNGGTGTGAALDRPELRTEGAEQPKTNAGEGTDTSRKGARVQLTPPGPPPPMPSVNAAAADAADTQTQGGRPTPEEAMGILARRAAAAESQAAKALEATGAGALNRRAQEKLLGRKNQEQMVAQTYGDLFAELNLSANDLDRLKKMLLSKAHSGSQSTGAMVPGTDDDPLGNALRALLGEENYAVYQDYEKTVPVRWLVVEYGRYLDSLGRSLSEEQAAKLHVIVAEERLSLPSLSATEALSDLSGVADKMAVNLEKKEESNAAILKRASWFLSVEQLAGITELQTQSSARDQRSLAVYRELFQEGGQTVPTAKAAE